MRIVAGGAGGFLVDDMEPVAAVQSLGVGGMETLVVENAVAVVAFVAKGVFGDVFRIAVSEDQLSLEQRDIG